MANGRKERKGTSLCRESPSVGTLGGDKPNPHDRGGKPRCKNKYRASSTSGSTCTAGAR